MKKTGILLSAFLISTLLMQFVWHNSAIQKNQTVITSEKINLVLRRTGHLLLQQAGDSTSQIPPVKQLSTNAWQLRIPQHFIYDSLPYFLQNALDMHHIKCNYDIVVLDCINGNIVLGYNFLDFEKEKNVPCGGRALDNVCYDIKFTLLPEVKSQPAFSLFQWLATLVLSFLLYGLGTKILNPNANKQMPIASPTNETAIVSSPPIPIVKDKVYFGHSWLDVANQELKCGETVHKLTYREAKLLHFFVQHPNQVLDRNYIMDNVWADEGVVVGRSIDMFVSRLRKMLRDDNQIQLVAVHGVGYKMEIIHT